MLAEVALEADRAELRVARMQALQHRITPGVAEVMTGIQVEHDHFASEPAEDTDGGVMGPMPEHTGPSGGWRRRRGRFERVAAAGASAALVTGAGLAARRSGAARRLGL
jgi:hypothetical protein